LDGYRRKKKSFLSIKDVIRVATKKFQSANRVVAKTRMVCTNNYDSQCIYTLRPKKRERGQENPKETIHSKPLQEKNYIKIEDCKQGINFAEFIVIS